MRETILQTPRSVKKEGGGGAPGVDAKIPLQLVVKTKVRQAVPLQSVEVHSGADIHLQLMENPTPEGMTHIGEFCGELSSVGGTPGWRTPLPKKDGAAETTCDELTTTLVLCPPVLLRGRS